MVTRSRVNLLVYLLSPTLFKTDIHHCYLLIFQTHLSVNDQGEDAYGILDPDGKTTNINGMQNNIHNTCLL
jgi:hypothetical protein